LLEHRARWCGPPEAAHAITVAFTNADRRAAEGDADGGRLSV
jgi:hypothetical protein